MEVENKNKRELKVLIKIKGTKTILINQERALMTMLCRQKNNKLKDCILRS